MHLLEARAGWWLAIDPNLVWRGMADEIVGLCLDRFIDRDTAVSHEFFALDWTPVPDTGQVVELVITTNGHFARSVGQIDGS